MFLFGVEAYLKTGKRKENLTSFRMERQIDAVKDLITVSRLQLFDNKIDYDYYHRKGIPKKFHRYEAFFFAPNIDGVVRIVSAGLPDTKENRGLFIDIFRNSDKKKDVVKLVEIHTAKVPEAIDEQEALKLSEYKPKQLLQIAEIIRTATSINRGKFYSFFKGPLPVKARS